MIVSPVLTKSDPPVYRCQYCGIGNKCDGDGEWYWVDVKCTCCSRCAKGKGIKIVRNRYTRAIGDQRNRDSDRRRKARLKGVE